MQTIHNKELVQCGECNGWLSPKAVFCTSCGAPYKTNRANVGWKIVRVFWTMVLILIVVAVFVA